MKKIPGVYSAGGEREREDYGLDAGSASCARQVDRDRVKEAVRSFINERTIERYIIRPVRTESGVDSRQRPPERRRAAATAETEAAGVEAVAEAGKLFIERNSRARGAIRTGESRCTVRETGTGISREREEEEEEAAAGDGDSLGRSIVV